MDIDIKSFYEDQMTMVKETASDNNLSFEQQYTSNLIEYMKEEGIATSPTLCTCYNTECNKETDSNFYKINAYDFSEEMGTLDLFVTCFIDEETLPEFTKKRIQTMHNALYNFFMQSIRSNALYLKYRESDPDLAEVIDSIRSEYQKKNIQQLRFFILSNGLVKQGYEHVSDIEISEQKIECEIDVWDIEMARQCEVAAYNEGSIDIPLEDTPLVCVPCTETNSIIKSYLTIISGSILAQIYKTYRAKLLNQNVRNYLGGKIKVNKRMIKTLREEPEKFFAYNNGITSTAAKVTTDTDDSGRLIITQIKDWQIVNGGQTTNTIFKMYQEDQSSLNNVHLALKISEIEVDNDTEKKRIISDIAEYANSQTAVKDSDLAAGHEFMKSLEAVSREETTPITSCRRNTKWFFVRMRGQYEEARGGKSTAAGKKFAIENPLSQKIEKPDVAKLEMAWLQLPHIASKGREVCFDKFWKDYIKKDLIKADKTYFHKLVAKMLIYETIKKRFVAKDQKGYCNIVCNYVLALIALKSRNKYNLEQVWDLQDVQTGLISTIDALIDRVTTYIKTITAENGNINPSVIAKTPDFWTNIKVATSTIPEIDKSLLENNQTEELTETQLKEYATFETISKQEWIAIVEWGRINRKLSLLERKRIEHVVALQEKNKPVTFTYAKDCLNIREKAIDLGWKK